MLDLVLTNAHISDVFRRRLFEGWAGIRDGRFIYVEAGSPTVEAAQTLDLEGRIIAPGLIDAHMHIESSLITPRRFAEAVLPWGTTTILSDPHEVGNVAGEAGVAWMIEASRDLPLRVLHSIPSCVPATSPEIEWTGEVFDAAVIARLAELPTVIALGEVMDYIGLLGDNPRLQHIVEQAQRSNLLVEGHIPTLSGTMLSDYLAQGVGSDHTLAFADKIHEQISKGVTVMLQTKSITPENVALVADLPDPSRVLLVTDDLEPPLLTQGHLSRMVQLAIEADMAPLHAIAAATVYPARYLGQRDLGAIAPGYRADFIVLDNFVTFPPKAVYVGGARVAENGSLSLVFASKEPGLPDYPGVPGAITRDHFRVIDTPGNDTQQAHVVTLQNKMNTLTRLETRDVQFKNGFPIFSEGDDLALATIIARNGESHFTGLIKNTGFRAGAFASTVSHDCHNLLVIGRNPDAMQTAARAVFEMEGGIAVVDGDAIVASLHLPFFGLLSSDPVDVLARDLEQVEDSLRQLGVDHARPFLTLSIMGLSVSPYVKFTDKGIVDTEKRVLLPAVTI